MDRKLRSKTSGLDDCDSSAIDSTLQKDEQKIMIIPKAIFNEGSSSEDCASVVKLRNPKSGTGEMFLFHGNNADIYQLMRFNEDNRSWFINDSVEKDGSVTFVTKFDALFLLLPYLFENTDKYRPLDQIVFDTEYPECSRLLSCDGLKNIHLITDSKESQSIKAYCYNEQKCLRWLSRKIDSLVEALKSKNIYVSAGVQSTAFVRNKRDIVSGEEVYQRYAHELLSEYLPSDISTSLMKFIGLTEKRQSDATDESGSVPPKKRAKTDAKQGPTLDYYDPNKKSFKESSKEAKKLTTAQKALSKVNKKGMKSINSFFTSKSK